MLLEKIKNTPTEISFEEVIAYIDKHYDFTPSAFTNGALQNTENQNNGSCKILFFSKINSLNKEETLHLFGDFYRKEVLLNPEGENHQNIRNFIKFGFEGLSFEKEVLTLKK